MPIITVLTAGHNHIGMEYSARKNDCSQQFYLTSSSILAENLKLIK